MQPLDIEWEQFVESVLENLNRLHAQGNQADMLIMLGRKDKQTGERKPPRLQVRQDF